MKKEIETFIRNMFWKMIDINSYSSLSFDKRRANFDNSYDECEQGMFGTTVLTSGMFGTTVLTSGSLLEL